MSRGPRKPLSVRVRFDVFKRDKFTCAYCGTTPPKAVLEVDHVVPVAGGGTDEIDNLVTACWDCNHGKAARGLGDAPRPGISPSAVHEAQERAAQLAEYRKWMATLQDERAAAHDVVMDAWCVAMGGERTEGGWTFEHAFKGSQLKWLKRTAVYRYLDAIGLEAVLRAVEVAADSGHVPLWRRDRYFYGICRRMQTNLEEGLDMDARRDQLEVVGE